MTSDRDTIFALSSGRPPAAIAVIRVSGPRAGAALERLIGRVPQPRRASLAQVRDPATHHVIDEGLVLWFPGPNSATGEDVAELHVHGGRAVIVAVLSALAKLAGLRHAEAGEFTRRSFENGRMELTAVEGLADLVAAETEAQRRQAYQQLRGLLGDRAESWRQRLIEALALVEAGIDFSDEEDVPKDMMSRALELIRPLGEEISKAGARQGERLREGLRVAIAGPPNAGKSTLFNRLARREAAIVSPFPGTTRDVLELHLDLGGYPVTVLDTAGMRETSDPIEREGVRRASEQAASADLVLWVTDATKMKSPKFSARCAPHSAPNAAWLVVNKTDLLTEQERQRAESGFGKYENMNLVSSSTGTGVDGLVNALSGFAERFFTPEPALVTRERQRAHLRETVLALERAKCAAQEGREEIMAEHLRLASRALGKLLGRVDVEDVLDVIFRDFCVGK
ncbi:MAG TPA: tRNA uridine-5-carboxymethylaminomethyl(34) synthesis GTPase MnmE [Xanthobacteraceae bacterium]|jgi:tRNA modification GTPase|nr:tRNA uridine-5-carboxymethylaminomethyl(34) synthesis GTPase MnmE [Xanthobacteraceae bacterium]